MIKYTPTNSSNKPIIINKGKANKLILDKNNWYFINNKINLFL